MSASSSLSPRCMFRIADERCVHPTLNGDTDDARCAACPKYKGRMRGLGDAVAAVTRATGIDAAARTVERVTGKPCGCDKRRAALNAAVPFPDEAKKES